MDVFQIAEIAIGILIALMLFRYYDRQKKQQESKMGWLSSLPYVDHFHTFDGLLEYCRQYLPNCYDRLLWIKNDPEWQARLRNRTPFWPPDWDDDETWKWDGIPDYRYFSALEILSKGKQTEARRCSSMTLGEYERCFRFNLFDDEEAPNIDRELIDELLPLPAND